MLRTLTMIPIRMMFFVSLVAALPCALPASADESDDRIKQKAREYFARGEILFDSGEYQKAAEAFTMAYEAASHPQVLFNIAICYDKAGWNDKAVETYRKYFSLSPEAARDKNLAARVAELEKKVGTLLIECRMENCEVSIDTVERGKAPLTVVLNPGQHKVEAFSDGASVAKLTAEVEAGGRSRVELLPVTQPDDPNTGPGIPGEPNGEKGTDDGKGGSSPGVGAVADQGPVLGPAFWITAGAAVAVGVAGGVFAIMTRKDNQEFVDSGKEDNSLSKAGERHQITANVLFGVAGAAALTAIIIAIVDVSQKDKPKTKEDGVAVAPAKGLALGVELRF